MRKILLVFAIASSLPIAYAEQTNLEIEKLQSECYKSDNKKAGVSCSNLGFLYNNGKGVEQNYKKRSNYTLGHAT